MKAKFILLGILSSSQLLADCCDTSCQRPEIYSPTECNSTRAYTHPYYDIDCNFGAFVTADFLYWYAKETDLIYGLQVQVQESTFTQTTPSINHVFAPKSYRRFGSDWKPGFRIGLGFNDCCDNWDIYAHWTYFQSKRTQSTAVPLPSAMTQNQIIYPEHNDFILLNPWINQSFTTLDGPFQPFNQINAKWRSRLNIFDLEIGKKYWLSPCFALRPYSAVRGAITRTRFQTQSLQNAATQDGSISFEHIFNDHFQNRYWGVGLLAGFQPNWHITKCLIVFGDFDASLIWGRMKAKKLEDYLDVDGLTEMTNTAYQNSFLDQFFKMQAILDLALGLSWQTSWCSNRFMTAIDLGWEHHIWFNHIDRIKNSDHFLISTQNEPNRQGFRSFTDERNDLTFGGLVVRLRIDF